MKIVKMIKITGLNESDNLMLSELAKTKDECDINIRKGIWGSNDLSKKGTNSQRLLAAGHRYLKCLELLRAEKRAHNKLEDKYNYLIEALREKTHAEKVINKILKS